MSKLIPLSRGISAIVDDYDFDQLSIYRWWSNNYGYAMREECSRGEKKTILMHRYIMGVQKGTLLDHKNGLRHDNRRSNLRVAAFSQNMCNTKLRSDSTSGYKGVCWDKAKTKWMSHIVFQGRQYFLGYYSTPEEAAYVYDQVALQVHGQFARINDDQCVIGRSVL